MSIFFLHYYKIKTYDITLINSIISIFKVILKLTIRNKNFCIQIKILYLLTWWNHRFL